MSFEDCERLVMLESVDEMKKRIGREKVKSPEIQNIFKIIEEFLRQNEVICYGGTAINNIIPKEDQFYDREYELPDYDFFSYNAVELTEELADIYANAGYKDVAAQSGIHHGTYKVFVNFIPIADITYIPKELFNSLKRDAVVRDGIHYAPPDYLRMSMYLELSRPRGDTSRWEKVLTRLNLLNKHYPLDDVDCDHAQLQKIFEPSRAPPNTEEVRTYTIIRDYCEEKKAVFFGAFAYRIYHLHSLSKSKYKVAMNTSHLRMMPDFDVFLVDAVKKAEELKLLLENVGIKVTIKKYGPYIDLLGDHVTLEVDGKPAITIYEPVACHSYHELVYGSGKKIRVATIDTILSMYLLFLYIYKMNKDAMKKLRCMAHYMYELIHTRRSLNKGLFQRFRLECYGTQETLETLRSKKMDMYKKLYKHKNDDKDSKEYKEYKEWFLKYYPTMTTNGNMSSTTIASSRPQKRGMRRYTFQI